ncbi:unnamed protein product [Orchesella dallaii]|uniref:G-protein coupled receptors family 1 profile domain-containing protein n=1 Tax=Orchesella dallaii TaxID=48710 RepID=A0ABP1RQ98_9HEXA
MERIDYWSCFFLDSKIHEFSSPADNTSFTYKCKVNGSYLSNHYNGHIFLIFLSILTIIISLFGTVSNLLNIFLLKKSISRGLSFRESLVILAAIEFVQCFFGLTYTIQTIFILEDFDRSKAALEFFVVSNLIFQTGRAAAFYHSILVTSERYLLIVAPFQSRVWCRRSKLRSFIGLLSILFLSTILNSPFLIKRYVGENEVQNWQTNSSLGSFPFLIKRSEYADIFGEFSQEVLLMLKSVAPFPVLLVLNGLVYLSIFNWNKRKAALTGKQKRDIKSAKMFSVVVFILLTCNVAPFIVFVTQKEDMTIYREFTILQNLSEVSGASSYIFVYYWFGPSFRNEFWKLVGELGIKILPKREEKVVETSYSKSRDELSTQPGDNPCSNLNVDDHKF